MSDEAFYANAFSRIHRFTYAVSAIALLTMFTRQGWRGAVGCAFGVLLSFANFAMWKRLADSLGSQGQRPRASSATLLGLRYLLLGGVIFVIIKYFEVSLLAIFAGLLTSVAAVLLEIVYQLIFSSRN